MTDELKLPSRFQIGDKVKATLTHDPLIADVGVVEGVTFYHGKVAYEVELPSNCGPYHWKFFSEDVEAADDSAQ